MRRIGWIALVSGLALALGCASNSRDGSKVDRGIAEGKEEARDGMDEANEATEEGIRKTKEGLREANEEVNEGLEKAREEIREWME